MYEFQNYALHESTVIVLRFDNTRSVYGFSTIFLCLKTSRNDHGLIARLPSSYFIGLKFHQLYLAVGMIGRWNKLQLFYKISIQHFQIYYIEK